MVGLAGTPSPRRGLPPPRRPGPRGGAACHGGGGGCSGRGLVGPEGHPACQGTSRLPRPLTVASGVEVRRDTLFCAATELSTV